MVTVIPLTQDSRMVKTAGAIHIPLWPLQLHVLAGYKNISETLGIPHDYLDFLTNLVEVGVVTPNNGVRLDVA